MGNLTLNMLKYLIFERRVSACVRIFLPLVTSDFKRGRVTQVNSPVGLQVEGSQCWFNVGRLWPSVELALALFLVFSGRTCMLHPCIKCLISTIPYHISTIYHGYDTNCTDWCGVMYNIGKANTSNHGNCLLFKRVVCPWKCRPQWFLQIETTV